MSKKQELILREKRQGLIAQARDELRGIYLGPCNPRDKEIARWFGGAASHSGVTVNEQTALNYSAVWAAVNLIAGDISSVPLNLYRLDKNGSKTKFDSHPLYRLIHDQPNPQMNSDVFRRTLQAHKLIWGQGFAEIVRDGSGRPVELWPLLPWAVSPYLQGGELHYRVGHQGSEQVTLTSMDVLHLRGLSDDGVNGFSVITKARESLGLGLAAERFGSTFFGNGSSFGGIISYPQGINTTPQSRKENRDTIEKVHQGPDRAHRFLALYEGAKYERLGIPPNDAQFLETRQFQIAEVARWFGVQPHKIGDLEHATFSNIEQQSIEYVTGCLRPHFVHWEQELTRKLVSPLERSQQMIKHNMEGLLRGDAAARGAFYSQLFQIGAITQNEIRELEDLNPIDGGDTPFVPLNSIPSNRLTEYVDALIEAKNQPPPPAPVVAPQPDPKMEEDLKAARKLAQEAEDARDVALATYAAELSARTALEVAHAELQIQKQHADDALEQATRTRREAEAREVAIVVERDALTADVARLSAERNAAIAARDGAIEAHDAEVKMSERKAAELGADRDAALALAADAQKERDAVLRTAAEAEAQRDSAKITAGQAENDKSVALLKVQTLDQSLAVALSDVEALKTDVARARSDIAAELEKQQTEKVALFGAVRHVFADAMGRMVRREVAKVKNFQANPKKLSAWIDAYYDKTEEDLFVEALLPAARLHAALVDDQTDPAETARALVREHFAESMQTLTGILDAGPDGFGEMVQRTLSRWESTRADRLADRIMEQEIRHVR